MALQHFLSPDQWIFGKDGCKNAFDIICLLPNVQRRQSTLSEHGFGIRRQGGLATLLHIAMPIRKKHLGPVCDQNAEEPLSFNF